MTKNNSKSLKKDKEDWKTYGEVMDVKTKTQIKKLEINGTLKDFNYNCVSSGKEANIYTGKVFLHKNNCTKFTLLRNTKYIGKWLNCILKIYKVSRINFKSRLKYIFDEKRFMNFCTNNSIKLIKIWAEKEVRNLNRIYKANILCPKAFYLKGSILIQEVITNPKTGKLAERLVDIGLISNTKSIVCKNGNVLTDVNNESFDLESESMDSNNEILEAEEIVQTEENVQTETTEESETTEETEENGETGESSSSENVSKDSEEYDDILDWNILYQKSIKLLDDLYNKAKLVHADFSPYNILVSKGELYIIDVGQSIDISSSNSNYFLINDINNNNKFFKSKNVEITDSLELFKKITSLAIPKYLEGTELNKDYFIPRSISEISNIEDIELFIMNNPPNEENKNDKENDDVGRDYDDDVVISDDGERDDVESDDDENEKYDDKAEEENDKEDEEEEKAEKAEDEEEEDDDDKESANLTNNLTDYKEENVFDNKRILDSLINIEKNNKSFYVDNNIKAKNRLVNKERQRLVKEKNKEKRHNRSIKQ